MSAAYPCPAHAWEEKNGQWVYCEQGPRGHEGTHSGARSKDEYEMLLLEAKKQKRERKGK